MELSDSDATMLRSLASYMGRRLGNIGQDLARRLNLAAEARKVEKGAFSVADINLIQTQINLHDFLREVMVDIARTPTSPEIAGAHREAEVSKAQAERLREYQALVRRLL